MSLEPLTIALGIPLARKATENVLSWANTGFLNMLGQPGLVAPSKSQQTLTEKLEQIAASIRSALRKQDIDSPFSIEVAEETSGQTRVHIQAVDQQQVEEVIHQNPQWLAQLGELVNSVQQNGPLGLRQVTARITENESLLTF